MKTRNLLALCGSAIAAGVIASLMYTIRGLLPSVATKVIIVILIIAGLTAMYAVMAMVKRIHGLVMDMRKKHLDHHEQAQRLLMDQEEHEWKIRALQAEVLIKATRVYPNDNGNYPAILPQNIFETLGDVLLLPPGLTKGATTIQQIGETKNELSTLSIPTAPSFREVMRHIMPEHVTNGKKLKEAQVVIACDANGAVLGEILDWLSTLVVGMPGMGKSTALYFFIAQLMMLTAKFQVLDPHASLISLRDLLPYVNRVDACIQTATKIEEELERRMDHYEENGGVCLDQHYMLIVDELPAIADREQQIQKAMDREEKRHFRSLIDVLRRVVCEGRKYKMYCMVVGQSIPATILPTIARDNMSSRYVFNCSADHARMAGLDSVTIENFLPSLEGNVGRCIVAPSRMKAFLGAIPKTTVDDLRYVIDVTGYKRDGWEADGNKSVNSVSSVLEPLEALPVNVSVFPKNMPVEGENEVSQLETPLPDGVTLADLQQIREAHKANWSLRDIARLVKMEGRNYGKFKAACDYLGINPKSAVN